MIRNIVHEILFEAAVYARVKRNTGKMRQGEGRAKR